MKIELSRKPLKKNQICLNVFFSKKTTSANFDKI